jgi:hypothetical protein
MKSTTRINKLNQHLEQLNTNGFTTEPVKLGNCTDVMPEFGRFQDVQRLFGINRGTLYNLIEEGRVKSVTLRFKGNIRDCRLFYLPSVSEYLHRLMEEQNVKTEFDPQI